MNKMITKQELIELIEKNEPLTIIDVRSDEEFLAQHIPGAINIQVDNLVTEITTLSKDRKYITACGKGGGRSEKGAQILSEFGLNAAFLEGGTFGWFE